MFQRSYIIILAFIVAGGAIAGWLFYTQYSPPFPSLQATSPSFSFNQDTKQIESSDPEIWIQPVGARKESDYEFVLHWKERRIGIAATSRRSADEKTNIWLVNRLCMRVYRWVIEENKEITFTTYCNFENSRQQNYAVELVKRGLGAFNNRVSPSPLKENEVEIAPELQQKLDGGVFLRKSK